MAPEFTPGTDKTALLVIDMQTLFKPMVSPSMTGNITSLVNYFRSLPVRNRAQQPHELGLVVFTQHGHTSEELDVPSAEKSPSQLVRKWGIEGSTRVGTEGWEFLDWIQELLGGAQVISSSDNIDRPSSPRLPAGRMSDHEHEKWQQQMQDDKSVILPKNTYDAFVNTHLEEVLKVHGIKRVVVCGVMTDCCCNTTARAAFNRGFETWLVKDACGSANETQHGRGLDAFGYAFGNVMSTREVMNKMDAISEDPFY
ncbi:Isochorismatase-like protein [Rhypophila decipiens]|uniref:Isochorismatase-like protein n=1 Tax=Rhypophila decipiens TaxID=261697 RepID=A0AAN6YHH5_9PEZI|nr:Isochorismatase-like protein [Rhypophila decipiens]